jgi:murein DD-endopeptidase MepM/ murein hydrolase activator NlpD
VVLGALLALQLTVSVAARSIQPGELLVVTVDGAATADSVDVTAFRQTFHAFKISDSRWQSLIGIDLDQRAGTAMLRIAAHGADGDVTASRALSVRPKAFPTRTLRVAPDFVNPPPELLERIARDEAFLRQAYGESEPRRLWSGPFVRPVPQAANSVFGTRSVFNGEPRSPHAGTDFLAPEGTPIKAPAAGRIVCARDLFFTGNTVIIDHGLGVLSILAHLSHIDVHEGETIEAAQIVGLVGATGRVTGAHLHWSLRVGTARVNPLAALALVGKGS